MSTDDVRRFCLLILFLIHVNFVKTITANVSTARITMLGLAALTLVVGSVVTILQTNIKRMLAYSSISHAGSILGGLEAVSDRDSANTPNDLSRLVSMWFFTQRMLSCFWRLNSCRERLK